MATSKGISKDVFSDVMSVVSCWYDEHGCISMLKVVYKDLLTNDDLSAATSTIDMLNCLQASRCISLTDLTLLYDTINITKQFGLEEEIKAVLPSFPNVSEIHISRLSRHRQNIVKFGKELRDDDIERINGKFNTPKKNYADRWSMINDLECRLIIREGKMETFIGKLKILKLDHAVKALVEVPYDASGQHQQQQQITEFADDASGSHNQQQSIQVPDDETFRQLLQDVSTWWKDYGDVNMLKVLLCDFKDIPLIKIEKTEEPFDLFTLLVGPGFISPSEIDVIVEAAVLGKMNGVQQVIKKRLPTFPGFNNVVIRKFTKHRQHVIKFGHVISMNNVTRIGNLYNVRPTIDRQPNQWVLIFELEKKGILTAEIKESFIKKLVGNDMKSEADAFK